MQIMKTFQNRPSQNGISKRQVPVDKKMRLIQSIRAENMDNRLKIRQRENFLYGTGGGLPPVLGRAEAMKFYNMEDAYGNGEENDQMPSASGTFRIRMIAAVILFAAFLLCDAGGYKILGCSANDIYGLISEDYFKLYNDKSADELPQLTELLKIE